MSPYQSFLDEFADAEWTLGQDNPQEPLPMWTPTVVDADGVLWSMYTEPVRIHTQCVLCGELSRCDDDGVGECCAWTRER